ncbi:IclR family transcriptional regulator [Rhodococcus sp. BP-252]|uniref:IclR family transcriptional regulator n=1 Tax=unclassified Rhodococcus (in: high G+C Gram-positive bacteria) TaxID=192944 RepID=UPI001C9A40F4|nr:MULTISPECIES: IclR family transcriptional regulator [unclassified Rhodococcus (in: high G+C Gram-positive bacteria)]MBY6413485.1 IclR family transcriptional regulator [Rhodococcus sp. BP-320]MBY6418179.1 IclR family transcriptional regulator [Rhodococcus sp. BP-321]MBY6422340.1 IclR family transcriptional regulator [Rhodococcus sp. BP-324]MBY6428679.1 IclR family transcriptional regulator [Rhodococcus sp. BP-323]MBY6433685.1 IclR family transcriptional regulator [Rhodococcus sp. BP-322]
MVAPIESDDRSGRDIVGAVLKACSLLEHFDASRPVWTLNDLTSASGMNKTTVHRLMATLIHAGWIDRTSEGSYRVAMPLFEIGSAALVQLDLRTAARPYMESLATTFGDTAFLMVPADEGAVCIDRLEGHNPLVVAGINIGSVMPYHAAAGPIAMLAFSNALRERWFRRELPAYTDRTLTNATALSEHLDSVRAAGYSVSNSDYLDGVAAVAAPILGRDGTAVASISIGGRVEAFEGDALQDKIDRVCDAAARLTHIAASLPVRA